ncbi:threonine-phosphate decarboxylase [Streptomyces sp. NA04227]|nr:threonine-phosphate decarboxylase [Streptomyces sp. NA04227]
MVLVVGVGASTGAAEAEVSALVSGALATADQYLAGPPRLRVAALATLDTKATEPALVAVAARLGVPLLAYSAARLAAVRVPHASDAALSAVGTPSVAEAAALCGGGELLVPKRKSAAHPARATCAVARTTAPQVPWPGGDFAAPPPPDALPTTEFTDACPVTPPPGTGASTRTPQHTRTSTAMHLSPPVRPDDLSPDRASDRHTHPREERTEAPAPAPARGHGHDLRHHGDAEVRDDGAELTDLAVNVRTGTPPAWLAERIAGSLGGLAAYPDGRAARAAVAARHGLPVEHVLLTAGAAEAFVLLARALPVAQPVVVHPQFTEPEAALRDAGHRVGRVVLPAADDFRLDPESVPDDADLVVIGNPTNPTSVLHPAEPIAQLARPGRYLVVDEAFMDAVPGERESLASRTDVPGLIVLRSLTKTWGLAGLRIGYVLAAPDTIDRLAHAQPLWPVSSPALAAAEACMTPRALDEAATAAEQIAHDRAALLAGLRRFAPHGLTVAGPAEGPFLLVRVPRADTVRARLRQLGFAVRRGDTFPGLDTDWLRIAVRDEETTGRLLTALERALGEPE